MEISNKIDVLNIVLILGSLVVSFIFPFELFLFSYAVLGPLHYITEINWLNNKNFFVKDKKAISVLLVFTIIISILVVFKYIWSDNNQLSKYVFRYSRVTTSILILISFIFSIFIVFIESRKKIIISLFLSLILSLLVLKFIPFSFVIVGVFVPTIIHVYLFTLLFMILGAIKNKSKIGVLAVILMCSVPFIIYFSIFSNPINFVSQSTEIIFLESKFDRLITQIIKIFQLKGQDSFTFQSIVSIKIQTFIAFAYTYHYLNWFSKTSVIGWSKNISKTYLYFIGCLWFLIIGLYYFNYRMGMITLFFLSMFHVIVEFPLNFLTIKEIFNSKKP